MNEKEKLYLANEILIEVKPLKLREKILSRLIDFLDKKIPEGAVVIDRKENPCLSCPVPTSIRETEDCSTICGAVLLGIDWQNQCRVLVRDYNRLEKDYQQARKETAREILKQGKYCLSSSLREWIIEQYGVEVE